jgi:hypothetical protein
MVQQCTAPITGQEPTSVRTPQEKKRPSFLEQMLRMKKPGQAEEDK